MIVRFLLLFFTYLTVKFKNIKNVKFNGFTIVYEFANSCIEFERTHNRIVINSHPLSNLIGLSQRSIIVARYGGKIKIGAGCGISGSTIYAMESITIGRNVLIGGNCKIIDNDFHPLHANKRNPQKVEDIGKRPIIIGDDCFIGANSIILKGTIIGRNCVIGAGSVVSGVFPDNVIIAGNPARIIKENS